LNVLKPPVQIEETMNAFCIRREQLKSSYFQHVIFIQYYVYVVLLNMIYEVLFSRYQDYKKIKLNLKYNKTN